MNNIITSINDLFHNIFVAHNGMNLILGGLYTTVVIFIFAAIFAFLLAALLVWLAHTDKYKWLGKPLSFFVYTIHDVPAVVLMMFFYYVLFAGVTNGTIVSIFALGVYSAGMQAKLFKTGLHSIDRSNYEAARMLGMTPWQAYKYVIIPQTAKNILPVYIGEVKSLFRCTSYAGYIAQVDLVKSFDIIRKDSGESLIVLLICAIIYLLLSILISKLINWICQKFFTHDNFK